MSEKIALNSLASNYARNNDIVLLLETISKGGDDYDLIAMNAAMIDSHEIVNLLLDKIKRVDDIIITAVINHSVKVIKLLLKYFTPNSTVVEYLLISKNSHLLPLIHFKKIKETVDV
jgi:hypothetical protein